MARLLVLYAQPGHRHSTANAAMAKAARQVEGITFVDLYAEYPRFHIDVDREQARLLEHDIVLFQFPMFWYSTPALIKEWQDLVLEHGFAYGEGGDALRGKSMMLAVTAAGSDEAYSPQGYQNHDIRTFLTPLQQTAHLCRMTFLTPFVLYGSLRAEADGRLGPHAEGYVRLLEALRDDRLDLERAGKLDVLEAETLPILAEV